MENTLSDIKGIDQAGIDKLAAAGISNIEKFIEMADTAAERNKLAKETGIDAKMLTEWLNRADLMRIKGVGKEFANLLEESGVDSCKELQNRVPANLHAKLKEVNGEKKLAHHVPNLEAIEGWVSQAKTIAASKKE
jgi:predicted flap endonuclease-1-like 5' DNA nuclease